MFLDSILLTKSILCSEAQCENFGGATSLICAQSKLEIHMQLTYAEFRWFASLRFFGIGPLYANSWSGVGPGVLLDKVEWYSICLHDLVCRIELRPRLEAGGFPHGGLWITNFEDVGDT